MNDLAVILATVLMLVFIFMKVPVFISIFGSSLVYFLVSDTSIFFAAQRITSSLESTTFLACPFFIMAGILFNYTGVTDRLAKFCTLATGRTRGGLAQANILLSTVMGGMSGSSNADAAMEAKIMVPPMEKSGLSKSFSTVVTAFSSTITPLIPPGIGMILYGTLSGTSIGQLFTWGFVIGVVMCVSMMLFTEFMARRRGYQPYRKEKATGKEWAATLKESWAALILPVIIIGAIRFGVVSASEAGAVAVVYALVLGIFWKQWSWEKFKQVLKENALSFGSLMIIMTSTAVYSWILSKEMIPQKLADFMLTFVDNKYVFLLVVNIFLLLVGMIMEGASATIILTPLLTPVALQYGVNPVHFGMMMIFNMSIGGISPPVGTLMYVTCGVTGCKIKDFLKESLPYFGYMLALLALITYVPFLFMGG